MTISKHQIKHLKVVIVKVAKDELGEGTPLDKGCIN
jgi:hypothetical protein